MTGSDALAGVKGELEQALIGVDYDGTLAPIVDDPAQATPLSAARDALGALLGVAQIVAVVSGRPVDFLRTQLGLEGLTLVGQYGLERVVGDGDTKIDDLALPFLDAVAAATEDATRRWPDLLIERKGELAVTVHWRTRGGGPPHDELRALAEEHGLAMLEGRKSCELRPPVTIDKGTAFADVVRAGGVSAALFAGDDRGDLSVFDTIDALQENGTVAHAARVGVRSDEAPPEILARADLVVDGPAGVAEMLSSLARP
jgi:trehalose 6-phosphate phosphatase